MGGKKKDRSKKKDTPSPSQVSEPAEENQETEQAVEDVSGDVGPAPESTGAGDTDAAVVETNAAAHDDESVIEVASIETPNEGQGADESTIPEDDGTSQNDQGEQDEAVAVEEADASPSNQETADDVSVDTVAETVAEVKEGEESVVQEGELGGASASNQETADDVPVDTVAEAKKGEESVVQEGEVEFAQEPEEEALLVDKEAVQVPEAVPAEYEPVQAAEEPVQAAIEAVQVGTEPLQLEGEAAEAEAKPLQAINLFGGDTGGNDPFAQIGGDYPFAQTAPAAEPSIPDPVPVSEPSDPVNVADPDCQSAQEKAVTLQLDASHLFGDGSVDSDPFCQIVSAQDGLVVQQSAAEPTDASTLFAGGTTDDGGFSSISRVPPQLQHAPVQDAPPQQTIWEQPQDVSGLFGAQQPQDASGLFGGDPPQDAAGLFGGDPKDASSLFGAEPHSNNAAWPFSGEQPQDAGLFGGANQADSFAAGAVQQDCNALDLSRDPATQQQSSDVSNLFGAPSGHDAFATFNAATPASHSMPEAPAATANPLDASALFGGTPINDPFSQTQVASGTPAVPGAAGTSDASSLFGGTPANNPFSQTAAAPQQGYDVSELFGPPTEIPDIFGGSSQQVASIGAPDASFFDTLATTAHSTPEAVSNTGGFGSASNASHEASFFDSLASSAPPQGHTQYDCTASMHRQHSAPFDLGRQQSENFAQPQTYVEEPIEEYGDGLPEVKYPWTRNLDPGSGCIYYFNTATGVSQWEPPATEPEDTPATDPAATQQYYQSGDQHVQYAGQYQQQPNQDPSQYYQQNPYQQQSQQYVQQAYQYQGGGVDPYAQQYAGSNHSAGPQQGYQGNSAGPQQGYQGSSACPHQGYQPTSQPTSVAPQGYQADPQGYQADPYYQQAQHYQATQQSQDYYQTSAYTNGAWPQQAQGDAAAMAGGQHAEHGSSHENNMQAQNATIAQPTPVRKGAYKGTIMMPKSVSASPEEQPQPHQQQQQVHHQGGYPDQQQQYQQYQPPETTGFPSEPPQQYGMNYGEYAQPQPHTQDQYAQSQPHAQDQYQHAQSIQYGLTNQHEQIPAHEIRRAHPLVTFGFGGRMVVMFPRAKQTYQYVGQQPELDVKPGPVQVYNVGALPATQSLHAQMTNFPGPLGPATPQKKLIEMIDQHMDNPMLDEEENFSSPESSRLLWGLVRVLVENGGDVSSEAAKTECKDALMALLKDPLVTGGNLMNAQAQNLVALPPRDETQMQEGARNMQDLLLAGDREGACRAAMEQELWAPALLLSSYMDIDTYTRVMAEFAKRNFALGSPLRTLYMLFAGQGPHLFERGQVEPLLDSWHHNMSIIFANRTPGDADVMKNLGDALWQLRGDVKAAHFCYTLADMKPEALPADGRDTTRMTLLGADHRSCPGSYFKIGSIIRTEMWEHAIRLANPKALLPSLQPYKLYHAMLLADMGRPTQALQYVEHIFAIVKATKSKEMWSPRFMAELEMFDHRVRMCIGGKVASQTSTGDKGFILNLRKAFDSALTSAIYGGAQTAGPKVPQPPSQAPTDKQRAAQAAQEAKAKEKEEAKRKKEAEKEAKAKAKEEKAKAKKEAKAASEDGENKGGFMSRLMQSLTGEKQVDLGEENQMYYNEQMGCWVERGKESEVAAEAVNAPPPMAASFSTNSLNNMVESESSSRSETPTPGGTSFPMASSTHGSGGNLFQRQTRSGARSRYVDTFNPDINSSPGPQGSTPTAPRRMSGSPAPAPGTAGAAKPKYTVFMPKQGGGDQANGS